MSICTHINCMFPCRWWPCFIVCALCARPASCDTTLWWHRRRTLQTSTALFVLSQISQPQTLTRMTTSCSLQPCWRKMFQLSNTSSSRRRPQSSLSWKTLTFAGVHMWVMFSSIVLSLLLKDKYRYFLHAAWLRQMAWILSHTVSTACEAQ